MNFQSNQKKNRNGNGRYNKMPPLSSGRNAPQGPAFRYGTKLAYQNCETVLDFIYFTNQYFQNNRSAYRSMPMNAGIPTVDMLRGEQFALKEEEGIMTSKTASNIGIKSSTKREEEMHGKMAFSGTIKVKATWKNPRFRQIPNYYPLESSTKKFPMNQILSVMANLSKSFRLMGIHAKYFENPAGAALLTPEHVESHLYFWKTSDRNSDRIYVELQR